MTNKNIQMQQRSSDNTSWDNLYPFTLALLVQLQSGVTVENAINNIINGTTKVESAYNADTAGGKTIGNANGNIPLANGTVNTNLNADMVDGKNVNDNGVDSSSLWTAQKIINSTFTPMIQNISNDLNNFTQCNSYFSWDTGSGAMNNTPKGNLTQGSAQVMFIVNYGLSSARMVQECTFVYPSGSEDKYYRTHSDSTWGAWHRVWTSSSLPVSQSVAANTVPLRDSNGYLYSSYLNINNNQETQAAVSYLFDSGDGWIRKKSLANVRAEIVTNGFGLGGIANRLSNVDLNNIINNGWYDVQNPTNGVSGLSWHSLFVISSGDSNYVTQFVFPMVDGTQGSYYIRQRKSGTWGSWYKVWTGANQGSGSGMDADTVDGYHQDQDTRTTASPTHVKLNLTQATGTPPMTVISTTKVANLNADQVDGCDAGNANGNIPVSNGTVNNNLNADMVDGKHYSDITGYVDTQLQNLKSPNSWIVPTFLNGAGGLGAPYDYPKYYKDSFGIVHLSGVGNCPAHTGAYFNLPAGYRPKSTLIFIANGAGGGTRIDIGSDGNVGSAGNSTSGYLSFCGISFRAGDE